MKKKILASSLLLALLALTSCSSNDDNVIVTPVESTSQFTIPTEEQFRDFQVKETKKLEQNLSAETNNASMTTFTSNTGVIIKTNHLTYTENGNVKEVKQGDTPQLKFVEIYERSQMVLTNRTAMGMYAENNNSSETKTQVASAGQFYMDMKVNNNYVKDFTIIMFVPTKNSSPKQTDMVLWKGYVDNDNNVTYNELPEGSTMHAVQNLPLNGSNYYVANLWRTNNAIFKNEQIGWIGIHNIIPTNAEKASLSVKAPTGYNMSNSAVYVINKNQDGVAQLDSFTADQKQGNVFTSEKNWLPIGDDATLLFMTIEPKTNLVVYALKDIKVEQNNMYTFEQQDLKITTTTEFSQTVNSI